MYKIIKYGIFSMLYAGAVGAAKGGDMQEREIGFVEHFFNHLSVAAIKITEGELKVGDTIHIKGHTTDFSEKVRHIQIEHKDVEAARAGDDVGVEMEGRCREHDKVFVVAS
jgi:putative protease